MRVGRCACVCEREKNIMFEFVRRRYLCACAYAFDIGVGINALLEVNTSKEGLTHYFLAHYNLPDHHWGKYLAILFTYTECVSWM